VGWARYICQPSKLTPDYNRPSPNAEFFIIIIVKAPVVQILSIILGASILAVEFPLPQVKQFSLYRSIVGRIVLLLFQVFLTILFYQVRAFRTLIQDTANVPPREQMPPYGH
jgi:hypothetical protein